LKIRCFSGFGKRFSEIIIVIYIKQILRFFVSVKTSANEIFGKRFMKFVFNSLLFGDGFLEAV